MNTKGPKRIFDHAPCQKKISNVLKISTITLQRDPIQYSIRGVFFQSTLSSMKIVFTLAIFVLMETGVFSQSPILIKDIIPGQESSTYYSSTVYTLDSLYIFRAGVDLNSYQYWVTDGTEEGTKILKDISPNQWNSQYFLFNYNHYAYFSGQIKQNGVAGLWRTDGTSIGTEIFMGSCGLNCSNEANNIKYLGGQLFTGTDSLGDELWFTNGLLPGTKRIKDIFPGPKDGAPQRFGLFKDKVYFSAKNNSTNRELWVTDATFDGTKMLKDINSDTLVGSDPIVIGKSKDYLFFLAKTLDSGRELWKTDGTPEGTKLVKDINPGLGDGVGDITSAFVNNKFLFVADDGVNGREWWVTNGESDGTFLLKDIASSSDYLSGYRILLANDSIVIFWVNDLVHGREIWRTDGTTNGTYLIKDIFPGTESSIQQYNYFSASYKNLAFFPGTDDTYKEQIWVTDGTEIGTKKITNMNYFLNSYKRDFKIINNYLYFTAATDEYGYEVWKLLIDTPVATQNPANPAQLNIEVYPNPNTGNFNLTGFLERPSSMQARLLDLQGRVLFTQQFEQIDGAFLRNIEVPQLPTGLYLLNIQSEQGTRTLPVSILKN